MRAPYANIRNASSVKLQTQYDKICVVKIEDTLKNSGLKGFIASERFSLVGPG